MSSLLREELFTYKRFKVEDDIVNTMKSGKYSVIKKLKVLKIDNKKNSFKFKSKVIYLFKYICNKREGNYCSISD